MNTFTFRPPYKTMFAFSILLAMGGIVMALWAIQKDLPWHAIVTGAWCTLIGALLLRMSYRAFQHGIMPRPANALLLVGVLVSAELWIAFTSGMLHF